MASNQNNPGNSLPSQALDLMQQYRLAANGEHRFRDRIIH
jgi:hypothetical protein